MFVLKELISIPKAHSNEIFCIGYSSDSKFFATGGTDNTICIWETKTGERRTVLDGHSARINAISFSPDGKSLASASGDFESTEPDNSVRIWNLVDFCELKKINIHEAEVYSVRWSADSNFVASGSRDSTVRIWNVQDSCVQHVLNGHRAVVYDLCFSPSGEVLASGGGDKTILIWETCSGKRKLGPLSGHTHWVSCVLFDRTGTMVISGSWDSSIRLWSAVDGAAISSLRGHTGRINCLALSPGGGTLASAAGDPQSGDCTLRLWALPSGAPAAEAARQHLGAVYGVAFSPDGNTLASASKAGDVVVWDGLRADARLALAMSLHPRLGRRSVLACLQRELVVLVADCLPLA